MAKNLTNPPPGKSQALKAALEAVERMGRAADNPKPRPDPDKRVTGREITKTER